MSITSTSISDDAQWHDLRKQVIGASEAAALVGEHPYLSYWGLWARKRGMLPPPDDNGAMERGRRLEPVAVAMIRDRYPEFDIIVPAPVLIPPRMHYADAEFGIGATPDMVVEDKQRGQGVIQIKSVAPGEFRKTWRGESDAVQVPVWIAIQALMEAHLTGSQWAAVAPLVVDYGIECPLIEVPLHAGILETIKAEALQFWRRVLQGREPDPDYRRDGALIRAVLGADDGSEIDLSGDDDLPALVDLREVLMARIRQDEKDKKAIDARIEHRMGNAAVARFKGGLITFKTVNRAAHEVKASTYRQLRVIRDHDKITKGSR